MLAADRVEYHVEPLIVGKALYVGFHCLRPIVDRLGSVHAHCNRARFRRYRGKNLCARRRGKLYGYVADAAGPAVNQGCAGRTPPRVIASCAVMETRGSAAASRIDRVL